MRKLEFCKMSATGNDFILIDNRDGTMYELFPDISEFARKVCRRHYGVGGDGLILIEKNEEVDFSWRFFNSDGSEAEMCGNGGRCAARFAFLKGIAKSNMTFKTLAGFIKAHVSGRTVKLQLTKPLDLKLDFPVNLEEKEIFLSSVDTGVPHAVIIVDNLEHVPLEKLGREIRFHKVFGNRGTNVDFVRIIDRKNVEIRTYERGVEGETYACGTGAVAVAYILRTKDLVDSPLNVKVRSGERLKIYIGEDVFLEGDTRILYTGILHEEALI